MGIPTGVFIRSIKFTDADSIILRGIIWQRFKTAEQRRQIPGENDPKIWFPQSDATQFEFLYRQREEGEEVMGWNFRAVISQEFDFSKFPFDHVNLEFRIAHADLLEEIFLTPDLEAYSNTNPASLPGIGEEVFLDRWEMLRAFYTYKDISQEIGIPSADLPGLSYNVALTRRPGGAFITYGIPLAVVLLLLFAIVIIVHLNEQRIGVFGFTTSSVFGYCAALFFIALIGHLGVRGILETQEVVYLESFHFISYGALLAVSINTILFTSQMHMPPVQWRQNLLFAVHFWPVVVGTLLIITLFAFT